VAKIDGYTSRASALAEDEPLDKFYRPARNSSKLRPEIPPALDEEDAAEEESFLRSRKRVPVRKGLLPKNRVARVAVLFALVLGVALLVLLAIAVRDFLKHDPRFRIDNSSSIQILGNSEITRPELLSVFGSDIGRNVFFIPLADRRADLERLPWVEHATVMRLLPNQLRVSIVERTPVAFVRSGREIGLVDRNGVILSMSPSILAARHFSFPVVTGIEAGDPLSTRAARMKIYQRFVADLDSGGEKVSEQLSEVDLTDPEDVKALMPEQGSDVLAHFGDDKFLSRYKNYKAHLAEWRQQYPHLASVDLRYDHQVVLEMEKGNAVKANENAEPESTDSTAAPTTKPSVTPKPDSHPQAVGKAKSSGAAKSARQAGSR
jgi:cell division protein FtsQ